MGEVKFVADLFLRCLSAVYMVAFASLYVQIPGLLGNHGILPARIVVQKEPVSWNDLGNSPTLLRYAGRLGLDAETGLDLVVLAGVALSFASFVVRSLRSCIVYLLLWVLYLSVLHVGQTFLWFQWDILLLEVGFLAIIIAPFSCLFLSRSSWFHQHDTITLWLVKWLLFRLMFASGVVKLTSGCPTWWGLTALNYHYETQCIPTPLAWYAHHLPVWFHKLSVASVFLIQLVLPFMFFVPSIRYRAFAAFTQSFLMFLIILTGNYNFFNWATIALCLPLLDDDWFAGWTRTNRPDDKKSRGTVVDRCCSALRWIFHFLIYGSLIYISYYYFSLHLDWKTFTIHSAITFTMADLEQFLHAVVPLSIWIGIISLAGEIALAFFRCLVAEKGLARRMTNMLSCAVFGTVAIFMFSLSLVPYTVIDQPTRDRLPRQIRMWHASVREYHLTSSYGLFRRMTGVGGRPEVIVEGSNSPDSDWQAYEFLYKPGDLERKPPVHAPHHPRLDWQMWFAALGTWEHNPWFLNFVYRLLTNETDVLQLIDHNPFPKEPPLYVRANLYHYHYTTPTGGCGGESGAVAAKAGWSPVTKKSWWCRKFVREYIPAVWKTDPNFVAYLQHNGIYDDHSTDSTDQSQQNSLFGFVKFVRNTIGQPDGYLTCVLLLALACLPLLVDAVRRCCCSRPISQPPADSAALKKKIS